jgi:ABC-type transporter Mla subunit MlaD
VARFPTPDSNVESAAVLIAAFLPVELSYVLYIALAFLLLQIYLCVVFYIRMQRHERVLARLNGVLASGGDGRDVDPYVARLPWLRWVDGNFPRDSATPANITRDDVLKELDAHIASDGHYLLLQRLGVMAPLLGVVITVAGFVVLKVPESETQSLADILYTVTPLVAGVGTGAILAFLNQWLLHFVGGRVEAVRNAARAWFDIAIWRGVGLDAQAATVQAITAIERMARSVTHAAEQQEATAARLHQSVGVIEQASAAFQQAYGAFGADLQGLPATLQQLTASFQSSLETLQTLIPVGQRAVGSLDVSVSTFKAAVENEFVEAAKTHRTSIDTLSESVTRIGESTARLQVSSGDLQETVNAHTNSFKALNRSLQKQVLPAHDAFLAAMTQFNGRAEGLLERLEMLHGELAGSLEKIAALAPDASSAIALFSASGRDLAEAIQHRFTPATDQHRHQVESITESVRQLQGAAAHLAEGGRAVEGAAKTQTQTSQQLALVQETLRHAVEQLADTAAALRQSFDGDLLPSHRTLHESTGSLRESSRHLASLIDRGIDPVTLRLTQLDETLARFAGTAAVIQDFTGVRSDIEHLSRSLAQAAAVADAIAALPQQIRAVLEEVAAAHQAQLATNSRRGWFGRGR